MSPYRRLRLFLRETGCEKAFDDAFYTQCGCNHLDETLAEVMGIDETFFAHVFDWRKTPQGREYWKEISDSWFSVSRQYHSHQHC